MIQQPMIPRMKQEEIDKLFGDARFFGQTFGYELFSLNRRDGFRAAMMVVIEPMSDRLNYRIDINRHESELYNSFTKALRAFREML